MYDTVDGSEIWLTTWDIKNLVNNGINYQPQLVKDFFHQQYLYSKDGANWKKPARIVIQSSIIHCEWLKLMNILILPTIYIYYLNQVPTSVPSLKQKNNSGVRPWVSSPWWFGFGRSRCRTSSKSPRLYLAVVTWGRWKWRWVLGEPLEWRSTKYLSTFVGSFLKWSFCWITWVRKSCTVVYFLGGYILYLDNYSAPFVCAENWYAGLTGNSITRSQTLGMAIGLGWQSNQWHLR